MNKPLLLTISSATGYPLRKIVIDMDKIVAMYEEEVEDSQERGKMNKMTKLLPNAGQHLQVIEGMYEIMDRLFPPEMVVEKPEEEAVEYEDQPGFILIESHRCLVCDGDCTEVGDDNPGYHLCTNCGVNHE